MSKPRDLDLCCIMTSHVHAHLPWTLTKYNKKLPTHWSSLHTCCWLLAVLIRWTISECLTITLPKVETDPHQNNSKTPDCDSVSQKKLASTQTHAITIIAKSNDNHYQRVPTKRFTLVRCLTNWFTSGLIPTTNFYQLLYCNNSRESFTSHNTGIMPPLKRSNSCTDIGFTLRRQFHKDDFRWVVDHTALLFSIT